MNRFCARTRLNPTVALYKLTGMVVGMSGSDASGEDATAWLPGYWSILEEPRYSFWKLIAIAASVSLSVFFLGYLVARSGGFGDPYLREISMYLALSGIFGGTIAMLWGARYQMHVWATTRSVFRVSDETYYLTIAPVLARAYSKKLIAGKFLLAFVLVIAYDLLRGIPMAIFIMYNDTLLVPLGHLAVINYLYGIVVLFLVVTGTNAVAQFLLLSIRITDFPVRDVSTAADRLEPIARFSIFASTTFIAGVILLLMVYGRTARLYARVMPVELILAYGKIVILVIAGLILIGILVFWIPQMAIHTLLRDAKQDRIAALNGEYERLLQRCREESGPPEYLLAELDIIEKQHRNATDIKTWSYNIPALLPLVGSAVFSAALWFFQFLELVL